MRSNGFIITYYVPTQLGDETVCLEHVSLWLMDVQKMTTDAPL